jgi:hypothetical protein
MSELAYNLNGEAFDVPGAAVGWRVRKMKNKGAPEVVYGRDGIPLILPIDADMDDLRREARHEGRYRVDPLDEHNRQIAGCPAGYVCIHDDESSVELSAAPVSRPAPVVTTANQALVEAMRIQAGLAQSVVDKFSLMLESAATLISAAQNAGMPQRLPRFFLDINEGEGQGESDQADNQSEAEQPAAPKAGLPAMLESVFAAGATAIVNAIVNGKIKIPGGLGALIDCRRAVPKDSGAAAAATFIPGAVPAPGPRDPAPATDAPIAPMPMSTAARPSAEPATAPPNPTPVAAVPGDLPTIDRETMQHFTNILNALTLEEQMHAQALAAELSPVELRAWIQDLKLLSIEAGVAKIRALLGTANKSAGTSSASGSAGSLGSGGVS